MDLLKQKALLALLAQSREHADNAAKAFSDASEVNDDERATMFVAGQTEIVELREAIRLVAAVIEQLVSDGVG